MNSHLKETIHIHNALDNGVYRTDEQYKEYSAQHQQATKNAIVNHYCICLNGFASNDTVLYESAIYESKFLKKYSKGSYYSPFNCILNLDLKLYIPNKSDVTFTITGHGKQDSNQHVLICDEYNNQHKPQDIIRKIRESLEKNIKDRDTSRDINIKFHACYGMLMTQNEEAISELKKLSKAFPDSRINLITEQFGAVSYNGETCLNQAGSLHPIKVFLNGKTHSGIFLTQEEIKQSKEQLIELMQIKHKNTIKPGFTIGNFISKNQTNLYVTENPNDHKKAYTKYMEDLNNKIKGMMIHLGMSIELINEFFNKYEKAKETAKAQITNLFEDFNQDNFIKSFIEKYNFPEEIERKNPFNDFEDLYEDLKQHEEYKKNRENPFFKEYHKKLSTFNQNQQTINQFNNTKGIDLFNNKKVIDSFKNMKVTELFYNPKAVGLPFNSFKEHEHHSLKASVGLPFKPFDFYNPQVIGTSYNIQPMNSFNNPQPMNSFNNLQPNQFNNPQPNQFNNLQPNQFNNPQPIYQFNNPQPIYQFNNPQPNQFNNPQPNQFNNPQPIYQFNNPQPNQFNNPQPIYQFNNPQPNQFNNLQPNQFKNLEPNQFNNPQPNQFNNLEPNQFKNPQPIYQFNNPQPIYQFNNPQPNQFKNLEQINSFKNTKAAVSSSENTKAIDSLYNMKVTELFYNPKVVGLPYNPFDDGLEHEQHSPKAAVSSSENTKAIDSLYNMKVTELFYNPKVVGLPYNPFDDDLEHEQHSPKAAVSSSYNPFDDDYEQLFSFSQKSQVLPESDLMGNQKLENYIQTYYDIT
ncbi:MAG: hypothetical protein U1E31_02170 [Rickettsiales bacterium]